MQMQTSVLILYINYVEYCVCAGFASRSRRVTALTLTRTRNGSKLGNLYMQIAAVSLCATTGRWTGGGGTRALNDLCSRRRRCWSWPLHECSSRCAYLLSFTLYAVRRRVFRTRHHRVEWYFSTLTRRHWQNTRCPTRRFYKYKFLELLINYYLCVKTHVIFSSVYLILKHCRKCCAEYPICYVIFSKLDILTYGIPNNYRW